MNILIAILGLSFLILIHEMGHYWAARWLKIPVVNFSIGFGPALFEFKNRHGTSFTLRAILLGGYVKFWEEDMPNCNGKSFDSHPVWKRMLTVIAGPATNLICAYIFFVFLGLSGVTGLKPIVGSVLDASPAQEANIQPNDEIISFNGNKVLLWQDLLWYSLSVLGAPDVPIVIEDIDGNIFEKNINLEDASLAELESTSLNAVIGMGPRYIEVKPIIGDVLNDSAAQTAGLEVGDEIVAINGKYITTWREFSQSIRISPNQNLELKVARKVTGDDNIITLNLIPASNPTAPESGLAGIRVGLPEVVPGSAIFDEYYTTATYPLSQVWSYASKQTSETLKLTITSFYQLLIGKLGLDSLGGPISIVQNVGISVEVGLQSFIRMLAFINLSLFFFNLLPIPVLDGGHLVNHIIEVVTKRKPSERFLRNYQAIGFSLLVTLFVLVTFNDITRLL